MATSSINKKIVIKSKAAALRFDRVMKKPCSPIVPLTPEEKQKGVEVGRAWLLRQLET